MPAEHRLSTIGKCPASQSTLLARALLCFVLGAGSKWGTQALQRLGTHSITELHLSSGGVLFFFFFFLAVLGFELGALHSLGPLPLKPLFSALVEGFEGWWPIRRGHMDGVVRK
jgi:hypothetical protein